MADNPYLPCPAKVVGVVDETPTIKTFTLTGISFGGNETPAAATWRQASTLTVASVASHGVDGRGWNGTSALAHAESDTVTLTGTVGVMIGNRDGDGGTSYFADSHSTPVTQSNLLTTALSASSLATARQTLREYKNKAGLPMALDMSPGNLRLVTPASLETVARDRTPFVLYLDSAGARRTARSDGNRSDEKNGKKKNQ